MPQFEDEEKEEIVNISNENDDDDNVFITYTDLRDADKRITLTAYTKDLHEYADFSQRGPYVVFCVGNGKPGLNGNVTRLHLLTIAKLSNYPVQLNRNGNLIFIRALCKGDRPTKKVLHDFNLFISNLRLMFALNNCSNFDQDDIDYEFSNMTTIIPNKVSLRKYVIIRLFAQKNS